MAETHDIDAQHDYPKERVFVSESPSSIEKWRSTGVTEEILAQWEPNEDGQFETNLGNGSVFLYLEGVNFRQAVFEGSTNGGSTWSTIGTFDARVNGAEMLYTKVGDDAIEVDATGNDSNTNRYLWYGEMVGGTTVVNTEQRRIRRNTEGAWQDNGDTTRQARIWMSGIDGGESGTAAMQLWAPRGVLIVHNVGAYDTYRVRIPSQTVADSYFECGRMMCGSIHPAGKQWSRGWSVTRSPNSTSRREPGGATRTRRTGKALRSATVAWPDGIDLTDLRVAAADPDYLIAGSGNELAAVDDVPYWLMGILEDMKSGEEPVLLLFEIPDASGNTITDWSLFLCGRFASQVSFDHSLGDENSNEFGRVSPITIEELP